MVLNRLNLRSFRNYADLKVEFSDKLNVLYGANGCGKTNILEAIYILGTGVSFRTRFDKELVKYGSNSYFIQGVFREKNISYDTPISMVYEKGTKRVFIDKKEIHARRLLIGKVLYTLFLPGDTELVLGEPRLRRDYFNMLISSVSSEYLEAIIRYTKILKMRNICLINKPKDASIYDDELATLGLSIAKCCDEYATLLSDAMNKLHRDIFDSNSPYSIKYTSSLGDIQTEQDYVNRLQNTMPEQMKMKTTFFGVHRAEYNFLYNGMSVKRFASHGEKRMFTLMMKLASERMVSELRLQMPIMLVDDAMLELDSYKHSIILSYIKTRGQVFIAVTEKENISNFDSANVLDIASY